MPAFVFSDLVMVHAELRLGFFKTLLNGPSDAAEPDENIELGTEGRIVQVIFLNRFFPVLLRTISQTSGEGRWLGLYTATLM